MNSERAIAAANIEKSPTTQIADTLQSREENGHCSATNRLVARRPQLNPIIR